MKLVGGIVAFVFALVILTTLTGSWFTIDQTERGALTRNGAYEATVLPGLHGKLPWVESVTKVDVQTHTTEFKNMEAYSSDQQPANLVVSVTWHISPDKIPELYARFGGDETAALTRLVQPRVQQEVKVVFGQYTAQSAITKRGPLNTDAANALTQSIAYDPVIVIEGVQVEDIKFSDQYVQAVEQRMQAEVAVQQQQQQLAQERVKADIAVTQATGQANSVKARADAEAYKVKIEGEAQASAIKARSEALNANPSIIQLTQAEKWNGQLPTTMVPGSALPFLNLPLQHAAMQ